MKQVLLIVCGLLLLGTAACKRCYECTREQFCATCTGDAGTTVVICSKNYSSIQEWEWELDNFSNCSRRSDGDDVKEICAKGWFGKTLLIADKEDLEFQGYTCTVK